MNKKGILDIHLLTAKSLNLALEELHKIWNDEPDKKRYLSFYKISKGLSEAKCLLDDLSFEDKETANYQDKNKCFLYYSKYGRGKHPIKK